MGFLGGIAGLAKNAKEAAPKLKKFKTVEVTSPETITFSDALREALGDDTSLLEKIEAAYREKTAGERKASVYENQRTEPFFSDNKGETLRIPKVRVVFKGIENLEHLAPAKASTLAREIATRIALGRFEPKTKAGTVYIEISEPGAGSTAQAE